jgi:pimeloyl-ACP methyl ester carboxylesterase
MAEEGWSGTFADVAAACDQVGELAAAHGADRDRITWAGHSAGGQLALWAASRPYFAAAARWYGVCDATHIVSLAGVNSLLGGGPDDVPERYAVADPAALTPPAVPVTLVHGTADDRVPVGMSRATGIGRLIELPGAGHFDVVDPHSRYWPSVLTAITGAF